jgi:hypothetical protein
MIGCRYCRCGEQRWSGKEIAITRLASGKIGGKQDMVYEQWMIVLLMALCVLEGLVFIEVRRHRLGKGPK